MARFKKKFLLPVCLAGVLAGYAGAEWIMPRYFHPTAETKFSPQDLLAVLGKQPTYYRQTVSGNYLAGRHAQNHKDLEKASNYINNVIEKDPDNIGLERHAMVLAMEAGQTAKALSLAKIIHEKESGNLLATLFIALEDIETENYLSATETLNSINEDSVAAFIVPILKLWASAAQGKLDITDIPSNLFYAYHVMLAGNYLNKQPEAVAYTLNAFKNDNSDIRDVEKLGDVLALAGEKETALKLYAALQAKGFTSKDLEEKITFITENKPINSLLNIEKIKNPKEGSALVFYNMAEILFREYSDDSALIFSQMALYLNPTLDKANMVIGEVLARNDRLDDAVTYFEKTKSDSDLYKTSQRQIANLYAEQEKSEEAISILMNIYKQYDDIDSLVQIGDIHRFNEDYKDAAKIYSQVLKTWDKTPEEYWHVLYARGMAYERLGEFKKSETDLQAALDFRPNHPYLLNYLAYSWADQGKRLNESLDMIKKALQLQNDDGYIADSLGWVYYKMAEFEESIPPLEHAAELLPYDATINDHLGDAYWRTGRKLEARFQWRRAFNASEESEAELKTTIEGKIVSGLTALPNTKTMTGSVDTNIQELEEPSL